MDYFMSIDVGIKHMSFCVLRANFNNSKVEYEILMDDNKNPMWNVIDVTPEKFQVKCTYQMKKKVCEKSASYSDGQHSYCNTHKKKSSGLDAIHNIDRNKMSMDDLFKSLVVSLDNFFCKHKNVIHLIKNILIEKQPPANPRMKMLMSAIHSYFIVRGKVDRYMGLDIKEIHIIDAKHKLSIYDGEHIDASHLKKKYDQRKFLSKEYTKYFIKDNADLLTYFLSFDKKIDDLADCYLQARYYIERVSGKKLIRNMNQLCAFENIDLNKVKKSQLLSEKKLSKIKTINLIHCKQLLTKYNIHTPQQLDSFCHKDLIHNCCVKYFGDTESLWTVWN